MIFTAKAQMIDVLGLKQFERALASWKEIWDLLDKEYTGGFMVHAEEVWLLAHKFLDSDMATLVSRFGVDDMAQARRLLTGLDNFQARQIFQGTRRS